MSVEVSPGGLSKTVTAAGTAERITASSTLCRGFIAQGLAGNGGNVHIGNSSVHNSTSPQITLDALQSIQIDAPAGTLINLYNWYVDAGTNGEGISVVYLY